MAKEFRICLIGCGGMTKNGHGPACRKYAKERKNTVLAACCDINLAAAEDACKKYGFKKAYTDYNAMIEAEKPDVVMAITPEKLTAQISCDVLKKKIPVILEKPPGMDSTQTELIHNTAIENDTPARAAFNRRYTPLVMALKEEMKAASSPILDIDCRFVRVGRCDADLSTTAIHAIDTIKYIAGSDYQKASFIYNDIDYHGKKSTDILMSAVMKSGTSAHMAFLPCGGCVVERITVTLTDHSFFLYIPVWGGADKPGKLVCMSRGEIYKTVRGSDLVKRYSIFEANGFYDESRIFFDELRAGKKPVSDVSSGIQSVDISHYIRQRKAEYISD